jgi:hypothetical protein
VLCRVAEIVCEISSAEYAIDGHLSRFVWMPTERMTEREYRPHPEQPERTPEELDGTNLLPDALKERMPPLYSQENERDPMVHAKFFVVVK